MEKRNMEAGWCACRGLVGGLGTFVKSFLPSWRCSSVSCGGTNRAQRPHGRGEESAAVVLEGLLSCCAADLKHSSCSWSSGLLFGEKILHSSFGLRWGMLEVQINSSMISVIDLCHLERNIC